MAIQSKSIPNLIQGVSQQAAQQRRDSQCEAQFNCVNSPKDGAMSRHGFDFLWGFDGADVSGAFFHEITRGAGEHYLARIFNGDITVTNLDSGVVWDTTHNANIEGWLGNIPIGGRESEWFTGVTIEDTTFLANRNVTPSTGGGGGPEPLTSTRKKEALFFFKAGQYKATYAITITYLGTAYGFKYKTPDNSTAANAEYIMTSQLAATFFRAMTGTVATTPAPSLFGSVGGVVSGDPGGTSGSVLTAPTTLTSLGFGVEVNGNLLRVFRTDDTDFQIDTADGQGDTFLVGFKEDVRSFSDLPRGGFNGMIFRVKGKADAPSEADYYVEYVGVGISSGYWKERTAPGIRYTLDPYTMPLRLINTGINTFTLGIAPWSDRICGDGVLTAKDPGFIGRKIEAMFYHKSRLAFLTEATVDWSKSRNVYTHFPDTVQTLLADAPIGIEVAGQDTTSILKAVLQADEGLSIWAQKVQFRVHSGNDPFKQDTVEADPMTHYEFAEKSNFAKAGRSVYFATEADDAATIRSLQFQKGQIVGDVDVTDHVPELIPAGVRRLAASDTGRMLFVQSEGASNALYLYNWIVSDKEVIQSAWNVWSLPEGSIQWCSVSNMHIYVAVVRGTYLLILKAPLSATASDPGGSYRTRLDLRISEAGCSSTYSGVTDVTTIALPYSLLEAEHSRVRIAYRTTSGAFLRGVAVTPTVVSATTLEVPGDLTGAQFYVGLTIKSSREESPFYLRSEGGITPVDSLVIREVDFYHDRTGYYRIEVATSGGRSVSYELPMVSLGLPDSGASQEPLLQRGKLTATVDADAEITKITLVNDSIFPSRWQSAEYRYEAVYRAVPASRKP